MYKEKWARDFLLLTDICTFGMPTRKTGVMSMAKAGSDVFYDFHTALSPEEYVWSFEKYCKYGEENADQRSLFGGIRRRCHPQLHVSLRVFTKMDLTPTNRTTRSKRNTLTVLFSVVPSILERKRKDWTRFRQMVEDYPIQGLKLYTAEWRDGSKGWRLNDPWAYKYFELAEELGVKNIHVSQGTNGLSSESRCF